MTASMGIRPSADLEPAELWSLTRAVIDRRPGLRRLIGHARRALDDPVVLLPAGAQGVHLSALAADAWEKVLGRDGCGNYRIQVQLTDDGPAAVAISPYETLESGRPPAGRAYPLLQMGLSFRSGFWQERAASGLRPPQAGPTPSPPLRLARAELWRIGRARLLGARLLEIPHRPLFVSDRLLSASVAVPAFTLWDELGAQGRSIGSAPPLPPEGPVAVPEGETFGLGDAERWQSLLSPRPRAVCFRSLPLPDGRMVVSIAVSRALAGEEDPLPTAVLGLCSRRTGVLTPA